MFQTIADFFFGEWIGNCPDTLFPALEPRLKIGNAGIDKIFFGFMEQKEVSSPGDIADNTDSSMP
jgi:hypothetical protein